MAFYLQHYFDPDFNFRDLKPSWDEQGQTDRYNLGYVQNAGRGQILAEIVPLETVAYPVPRFILEAPIFPAGANTRIDRDWPQYLLSTVNGYVFYHEGNIVVKPLLNIRADVDFRTGNIFFVGDTIIHKDIKAGFQVQSNSVLIKGMVEGGIIRSRKVLKIEGGARGGAGDRCLLDAGSSLQAFFVEKTEVRARDKLVIERFATQCSIYSKGDLIIRDLLVGGTCHVARYMLVKGNLGNKANVITKIFLGYDPFIMRETEQCDARLAKLTERINQYKSITGQPPQGDKTQQEPNPIAAKMTSAKQKRQMLLRHRETLWKNIQKDSIPPESCRLFVLGTVYPGVEVSIGLTYFSVNDPMSNVCFRFRDNEVIVEPVPDKIRATFSK